VHGHVYILFYVDDLIVAGESLAGVQMVEASVSASFDVRDMGEVQDFTDMNVMRDRAAKVITLSNPENVSSLLEAFQMDKSAPNKTLMVSDAKLRKTGENLLPEGNRYAEPFGSFLYLSTTTRPDIAFAVGVLSRCMSYPEEDHIRAARGVLRYVRGATRLGVVYGDDKPLQKYVDANWTGDNDGHRSTTGFVFTLNGGPISWTNKRQSTVATSTAEAENVADAMETKQALWLRKLLSELGFDGDAVTMGEDNQACLALVSKPEATGRTKHLDVAYHMVRDYVACGEVVLCSVPSAEMPADGMTKPLRAPVLTTFRGVIGVGSDCALRRAAACGPYVLRRRAEPPPGGRRLAAEWRCRRPGTASGRFGGLRQSRGLGCISTALLGIGIRLSAGCTDTARVGFVPQFADHVEV